MMLSGEKHNTICHSFASLKDKSERKKPIFFQRTSFSVWIIQANWYIVET